MQLIFLGASIFFLLVGHYYKTLRWKQSIDVYENMGRKVLLQALSLGYLANFFLPYRIGEVVRVFISGRKMRNGYVFSFATVIVERILDIFAVSVLFVIFMLSGFEDAVLDGVRFYIPLSVIMGVGLLFCIKYSRIPKKIIKMIAGIFNDRIKFQILLLFFSVIAAIKDIYRKLSKQQLCKNTFIMWVAYLISYACFAQVISSTENKVTLTNVFTLLFSRNNLEIATANVLEGTVGLLNNYRLYMAVYTLAPIAILLILSFVIKPQPKNEEGEVRILDQYHLNLLPHLKAEDKLQFLEEYFESNKKENLSMYLEMNREIGVIQDFSAGSNATTMLCMDNENTFYRKYAFFEEGVKLFEQVTWLLNYKDVLPLTKIIRYDKKENYCCYDMEYNIKAVGFFQYCHSVQADKSWKLLKRVLEDMESRLYIPNIKGKSNETTVAEYIEKKIYKNLNILTKSHLLNDILSYQSVFINGREYRNLNNFDKYFEREYLKKVFLVDDYTVIHGDLTVENIVCLPEEEESTYYIIDPNTGNIHDSANLDFGKLLQSLHGGYEFLMKTGTVSVEDNRINYAFVKSEVYTLLYHRLDDYMRTHFSEERVKSIYFHEIVHWLRLLPYKLEKNGKRALLFYAGFIIILNDIMKWYGADDEKK